MRTIIRRSLWVAIICIFSLSFGCSPKPSNDEFEKVIRSTLDNGQLSFGVRVTQLEKLAILEIFDSKDASKIKDQVKGVDWEAIKQLEKLGTTKVYLVTASIKGKAAIEAANQYELAYPGTALFDGDALFFITKDKNSGLSAQLISTPELSKE